MFSLATGDEPKKPEPKPKFPIGKETTFVTGPLDEDGFIDFEAALNERLGKGISPDKNANVLLWKVLGPRPEGGKGMPPAYFKALGIDEPPDKGDYLIGIETYVKDHLKLEQADWMAIFDQQSQASQRPWTIKDYPHIAGWLAINEKPLAVAVEASKRPDYFNPLTSHPSEQGFRSLINALLPSVQKCRAIAAALSARAMLRVSEGKFDDAWQDLLALHRLGRLVGRGATLIESLVGIAIDQIAVNAELAYLENVMLTSQQVLQKIKELQALPPTSPMADKLDIGERFLFLDSVQLVRRGGAGILDPLDGKPAPKPDPKELEALAKIDWEPALRNGNQWYDRMVAALRTKDRTAREAALDKIDEDVKGLKKETAGIGNLSKLLLGLEVPEKSVGKAIGNVLISLFMPATRKVGSAFDRIEQVNNNQLLAFALAAYRIDKGRYPAMLEELAPKYLAMVPSDVFSGKPLIYRPDEKGYLLYSIGANGKDEEGRWYDDTPPGDDPRVRMPLPALKPGK